MHAPFRKRSALLSALIATMIHGVAVAEDVKGFAKPTIEGDMARRFREFVSIKMNPKTLYFL